MSARLDPGPRAVEVHSSSQVRSEARCCSGHPGGNQGSQACSQTILLEVGGEWCSWYHTLDRFFEAHAELIQLRDRNFVTVKINFSEMKTKTSCPGTGTFLAILTYSCLIRTASYCFQRIPAQWKSRKSYDLQRLTAFLKEWAPAGMQ